MDTHLYCSLQRNLLYRNDQTKLIRTQTNQIKLSEESPTVLNAGKNVRNKENADKQTPEI